MPTWYSATVVVYSSALERSTDRQRYQPASESDALRISSPSARSWRRVEGVRGLPSRSQVVCARLEGEGQWSFRLPPCQMDRFTGLKGSENKTDFHVDNPQSTSIVIWRSRKWCKPGQVKFLIRITKHKYDLIILNICTNSPASGQRAASPFFTLWISSLKQEIQ